MIYYQKNNYKSYSLAEEINKEFLRINEKLKPLHIGDFYLLNNTKSPGIFIECGFLTNSEERRKLLDSNYQNQLVKLIINGIKGYVSN